MILTKSFRWYVLLLSWFPACLFAEDAPERPKKSVSSSPSGFPACVISVDSDHTLRRTKVKNDPGTGLAWVIRKEGQIALERNAREEMSYQFVGNTEPGIYTAYLHQFVDGAYRVISNVVSYEITEKEAKPKPPCHLYLGENHVVNRSLVDGEQDTTLSWQVKHNGKVVLKRNARNETQYRYFGTKPGRYEIVVLRDGERISNVIRYTRQVIR